MGIFHTKMGSIKDRNGIDLTGAEDFKKRWQEYWTELPSPPPGDLPQPGIESESLASNLHWHVNSLRLGPPPPSLYTSLKK